MILTDKEMAEVRRALEAQAGLDEELMRRCGHLIHMGAFDEAVRNAFILLEERLRPFANGRPMTGTQLANYVFSPGKGPLSQQLGHSPSEQEGLREIYAGAFKLFRNPTAHGVVEYDAAEGKAIVGLVDVLLKLLKFAEKLPPPGIFPDYLETVLDSLEEPLGPGATGRLRRFLGRCIMDLGIEPDWGQKNVPFRRHTMYQAKGWSKHYRHATAVFYLNVEGKHRRLWFPITKYLSRVKGLDHELLTERLLALGADPRSKRQDPTLDLNRYNEREFFEELFEVVSWVVDEYDESLKP